MDAKEIETLKAKFEKERDEFPIPSLSVREYFDKMIGFCELALDGLKWRSLPIPLKDYIKKDQP